MVVWEVEKYPGSRELYPDGWSWCGVRLSLGMYVSHDEPEHDANREAYNYARTV